MAGITFRDEELGIETTKSGPEWQTISRDYTKFLETGDSVFQSFEALDLGAGCFVRFPSIHLPLPTRSSGLDSNPRGEKTWIPNVHLEKTEDGWTLAPGAAQERNR